MRICHCVLVEGRYHTSHLFLPLVSRLGQMKTTSDPGIPMEECLQVLTWQGVVVASMHSRSAKSNGWYWLLSVKMFAVWRQA